MRRSRRRPPLPEINPVAGQIETLAAQITGLPPAQPRLMVAIAGPPASGKSTLAAALANRLTAAGMAARHVPMDGFHLDNAVLAARGLLERKGAPETFDAAGFVHAMGRLATEPEVVLPAFDRERDIAIAGRIALDASVRVAVVEGNYLAFDERPWSGLGDLWRFSVFLDVSQEALAARLIARWRAHGLDAAAAEHRTAANDLPNARRVLDRRVATTLTLLDTG